MNYASSRDQYLENAVMSASPAALLLMLYDRAIVDLHRAEQQARTGDPAAAGEHLLHAQEIVTELNASLDTGAWAAGEQLRALYLHLHSRLITANTSKDPEEMAECRGMLQELRDAWYEASKGLEERPTSADGELGIG